MPSKRILADNTTPANQIVAAEVRTHRQYPTSITFDNKNGAVDHTFTIIDILQPSPSHGNSYVAPGPVSVNRGTWDVALGSQLVLEKDDLEGIKCLGSLNVQAEANDAACFVTVGYRSD